MKIDVYVLTTFAILVVYIAATVISKETNINNYTIMRLRSGYETDNIKLGNIDTCGNCVMCTRGGVDTSLDYCNKVTGETFNVYDVFNCSSQRIIYLVTCKHTACDAQYVGRTISQMRKRYGGHRSGLRTKNEPKHVLFHFTCVHKPSDMIIKPLVYVSEDEDINEVENFYILMLNTLYPYGLNDRLEKPQYLDAQATLNDNGCIFKLFEKPGCKTVRKGRGKGTNKLKIDDEFDVNIMYDKLEEAFSRGNLNNIRALVASCNVNRCNMLGKLCLEKKSSCKKSEVRFLDMIIDLCNHYRYRTLNFKEFYNKRKNSVKENNEFVPILLANKNIDNIGINYIFNKHKLLFPVNKLPKRYCNDDFKFSTCYKYQKPIRNKVLNYCNVVNDTDDSNVKCCCNDYLEYIDRSCGHVLTGNLRIISNRNLRNLLSKGTKYIEQLYYSKPKILNSVKRDIEDYINKIALKYSLNKKLFDIWKNKVLDNIKEVINNNNITFNGKVKSIVDSNKEFWDDFRMKFVLCPVDKAGNNVAIICKKYYIENIEKELNTTNTYNICNESESDIIQRHIEFCKSINIEISSEDEKLPILYMMPKFHKNPVGSRYIAASVNTSLKLLSKLLSPILKSILERMKSKVKYEFKFCDTSGYWVADNNFELRKNLENLNNMKAAHNINCFDFKTLYTNIPHLDLKNRICKLIEEMFELKSALYVNFWDSFRISWSKKSNGQYSFTCNNVKDMLNYLLDNIYVKFRGKIYKQVIGVPMGCDCAPFSANLYLFSYEYSYINDLNINKDDKRKFFKFCCRYIDDLCVTNGPDNFLEISKDIYPECLILEKTNSEDTRVTFLDMDICINNNQFNTKLYDKRKDFDFNVLSMPNMRSNIPERQTYGIFYSQLFRLCHVNSNLGNFVFSVKELIVKLLHQNFIKHKLLGYLNKFIKSNHPCTFKYWEKLELSMFL